ncbi:MAG: hypothetical protein AMXMBFR6_21890 [Betaproteobacteria bacterium]
MPKQTGKFSSRLLSEIADEVRADWTVINNSGARDALDCMSKMGRIGDSFGADPNGYSVIATFLSNAIGWRGPTARRIKKELRAMGV